MVECARHINLVRSPAENGDALLEKVLSSCSYPQRTLLQKLYRLLQSEHLARLVMTNVRKVQCGENYLLELEKFECC